MLQNSFEECSLDFVEFDYSFWVWKFEYWVSLRFYFRVWICWQCLDCFVCFFRSFRNSWVTSCSSLREYFNLKWFELQSHDRFEIDLTSVILWRNLCEFTFEVVQRYECSLHISHRSNCNLHFSKRCNLRKCHLLIWTNQW